MLTREHIAYVVGVLWDADKVLRPEWATDWTCDYLSRHTILDAILYRIEGWLMRKGGRQWAYDNKWVWSIVSQWSTVSDPDRTDAILRAAWLQLEAEGKIPTGKEWPG